MSPQTRSVLDQLSLSAILASDDEMDVSAEDEVMQEVNEPVRHLDHAEVVQLDQMVEELEMDEGEQLLLGPRVHPTVPPPGEVAPGWQAIDSLGSWDSFFCKFPVLQEVPEQHKGAWAQAWGERAETELETTRALMWLGFLAQALLRKPTRGGRAGRREVAKRFLCVNEGTWSPSGRKMPSSTTSGSVRGDRCGEEQSRSMSTRRPS